MKAVTFITGLVLSAFGSSAHAEEADRKDFYRRGENFVSYFDLGQTMGNACGVRFSNGSAKGAITFTIIQSSLIPFTLDMIYGHELGTGTTHGARKGDPYEVRVDGELLATGKLKAGAAPYEGAVDEWQGALLDALAYGKVLTWGFPGQDPLILVEIPDNRAMTVALVECEKYTPSDQ